MTYRPAGPLFVRTAATPGGLRFSPHGESQLGAGGDAAVRRAAADPLLREALDVAGNGLGPYVDDLLAGVELPAKRARRTAVSVSRYALRARSRATPFGLFAGVAPARTGSPARGDVSGAARKRVRIDAGWLHDRLAAWLAAPEVRRGLDVVLDDRCRTRGGRLVLPGTERETSVALTPLVARVRERTAAGPVPYADLLTTLPGACPGVTAAAADDGLARLVRHGFLLTSVTPHELDDAYLDRLELALGPLPGAAAELRHVRGALRAYERTAPGEGRDAWRELLRVADPEGTARRPPAQVDLRPAADVVLPPAVADEAAAYAAAMWDLSWDGATHAHLAEYKDRFLERYGTAVAVPLGRLVDPHRGLGVPLSYGASYDAEAGAQEPPAAPRARRVGTAELLQRATLDGSGEIRLTPDVLARLAPEPPAEPVRPPASLELCLQLLADSPAAIDDGDFLLACAAQSATWLAGAGLGRFAEPADVPDLTRIVGAAAEPGVLPAQVVFRPRAPRALNLVQVPRLLEHTLPVGVYADRREPGVLDWRELLVSADPAGFTITHADDGRRVLPVVPHMLALDREAPAVVRLLVDLAFGRTRTWSGWDWCGLEALPFLPRVRVGRVVVSPRRWLPDHDLRAAAARTRRNRDGDGEWPAAVARWRERYGVPDLVQLALYDRGYVADLTDPWHLVLFAEEVRAGERCVVYEDLSDGGRGFGWAGGHATEVVFPLVRADRTPEPVRVLPPAPSGEAFHLPGDDWLYAKLFAAEDTHDELIAEHLPGILRGLAPSLAGWHFVRYRDPAPHLRLRLRGEPETLRRDVLPALTAWLRRLRQDGIVRAVAFDTYEPETERYGGPAALPCAEAVFGLDSASALAQIRNRTRGRLDLPAEVLAALNHALLLESLGDWDWAAWVARAIPKGPDHETYRRHRDLARALIVPGDVAANAAGVLGETVAGSWREAPDARAYGTRLLAGGRPRDVAAAETVLSLLHMQHNRLLGIDRAREARGYAVLRGAARDHLSRVAHEERAGA